MFTVTNNIEENVLTTKLNKDDSSWYIDCGATSHCCFNKSLFHIINNLSNASVSSGSGELTQISGVGDITIPVFSRGEIRKGLLKDDLYIPDFKKNLISVSRMGDIGVSISFENGLCLLKKNAEIVAEGIHEDNLYKLKTPSSELLIAIEARNKKFDLQRWHNLLLEELIILVYYD